jgi:hypothetical protein
MARLPANKWVTIGSCFGFAQRLLHVAVDADAECKWRERVGWLTTSSGSFRRVSETRRRHIPHVHHNELGVLLVGEPNRHLQRSLRPRREVERAEDLVHGHVVTLRNTSARTCIASTVVKMPSTSPRRFATIAQPYLRAAIRSATASTGSSTPTA